MKKIRKWDETMSSEDELNRIGHDIIGCAFLVRNILGKYLREGYYEGALAHELTLLGHTAERQVYLPGYYKGVEVTDKGYKIDLLVDRKIIVEVKSEKRLNGEEFKQTFTYLKLSGLKLGYLLNFTAERFTPKAWTENPDYHNGIFRIVNGI